MIDQKGEIDMNGIISPSKWGKIIQLIITILTALAGVITGSSFTGC